MKKVKSCGFLIIHKERQQFLLLKHHHRYDFPKGHIERGESDLECAFRELQEETGITREQINTDGFSCEIDYLTRYKRFGNKKVHKTVVMFLGWLKKDADISVTEHPSFEWCPWPNKRKFKEKNVVKVLEKFECYLL